MSQSRDTGRPPHANLPGAPRTRASSGLALLLVAGVLGVAAGPAGLGRVAPRVYERVMFNSLDAQDALEQFDQEATQGRDRLQATGVTNDALTLFDESIKTDRRPLVQHVEHARARRTDQHTALASALVMAIVFVTVIESIAGRQHRSRSQTSALVEGLRTARVGLTGGWIFTVSAQPSVVAHVSVIFVALLITVAIGVSLIPLGRQTPVPNQ